MPITSATAARPAQALPEAVTRPAASRPPAVDVGETLDRLNLAVQAALEQDPALVALAASGDVSQGALVDALIGCIHGQRFDLANRGAHALPSSAVLLRCLAADGVWQALHALSRAEGGPGFEHVVMPGAQAEFTPEDLQGALLALKDVPAVKHLELPRVSGKLTLDHLNLQTVNASIHGQADLVLAEGTTLTVSNDSRMDGRDSTVKWLDRDGTVCKSRDMAPVKLLQQGTPSAAGRLQASLKALDTAMHADDGVAVAKVLPQLLEQVNASGGGRVAQVLTGLYVQALRSGSSLASDAYVQMVATSALSADLKSRLLLGGDASPLQATLIGADAQAARSAAQAHACNIADSGLPLPAKCRLLGHAAKGGPPIARVAMNQGRPAVAGAMVLGILGVAPPKEVTTLLASLGVSPREVVVALSKGNAEDRELMQEILAEMESLPGWKREFLKVTDMLASAGWRP